MASGSLPSLRRSGRKNETTKSNSLEGGFSETRAAGCDRPVTYATGQTGRITATNFAAMTRSGMYDADNHTGESTQNEDAVNSTALLNAAKLERSEKDNEGDGGDGGCGDGGRDEK